MIKSETENPLLTLYKMLSDVAMSTGRETCIRIRVDAYEPSDERLVIEFYDKKTLDGIWSAMLTMDMIRDSVVPSLGLLKHKLAAALRAKDENADNPT